MQAFFGEMNKLSERNVNTDNYFWQDSYKNCISCKIQDTPHLQNFCKKWESVAILLQEFCKITSEFTSFARYVFFYKNFAKSCIDCTNFAKFLHKLFFLWTREDRGFKINSDFDWAVEFDKGSLNFCYRIKESTNVGKFNFSTHCTPGKKTLNSQTRRALCTQKNFWRKIRFMCLWWEK